MKNIMPLVKKKLKLEIRFLFSLLLFTKLVTIKISLFALKLVCLDAD